VLVQKLHGSTIFRRGGLLIQLSVSFANEAAAHRDCVLSRKFKPRRPAIPFLDAHREKFLGEKA